MKLSVKFCVDSNNNVANYSSELNPGENFMFTGLDSKQQSINCELKNEKGQLFIAHDSIDQEGVISGGTTQLAVVPNDVINLGSTTIMITSVQASMPHPGAGVAPMAPPVPPRPGTPMPPPIPREEITSVPAAPVGKIPESIQSRPESQSDNYSDATQIVPSSFAPQENTDTQTNTDANTDAQVQAAEALPSSPAAVQDESGQFEQDPNVDISKLPSVDGANLQLNLKFAPDNKGKEKEKDQAAPKTERKPPTRTREQLFLSDARDRRFYVNGSAFSIRNKMSALALSAAALAILIYSYFLVGQIQGGKLDQLKSAHQIFIEAYGTKVRDNVLSIDREFDLLVGLIETDLAFSPRKLILMETELRKNAYVLGCQVYVVEAAPVREVASPPSTVTNLTAAANPALVKVADAPATVVPVPGTVQASAGGAATDNAVVEVNSSLSLRKVFAHYKADGMAKFNLNVDLLNSFTMKKLVPEVTGGGAFVGSILSKGLDIPQNDVFTFSRVVPSSKGGIFVVLNVDSAFLIDGVPQSDLFKVHLVSPAQGVSLSRGLASPGPAVKQSIIEMASQIAGSGFSRDTEFVSDEGDSRLGMAYKLTSGDVMMSSFSPRESIGGTFTAIRGILLPALLSLFITVFLGAYYARTFVDSIKSLTTATENVAAGNYNQLQVTTNDEIGVLADNLNHLIHALSKKESSLESATALANKDQQTGLYNSRHFRNQLSTWFETSRKTQKPLSILYIDVDDMKRFNDLHGHTQGDLLIKGISNAIRERTRPTDIAARYNGEEFGILCPNTNQKVAADVAEAIRSTFQKAQIENLIGGEPYSGSCSIGVATVAPGSNMYSHPEIFLKAAQDNVRLAKSSGKNRIWSGAL